MQLHSSGENVNKNPLNNEYIWFDFNDYHSIPSPVPVKN